MPCVCKAYNISFPDLMLWFKSNAYQDLLTDITVTINPTPYFTNKFQNELLADEIRNFFNHLAAGNCFNVLITSLTEAEKQKLGTVLNTGITELNILTKYFTDNFIGTFNLLQN